jgi:alpha-D-xyloside xylohydrolase
MRAMMLEFPDDPTCDHLDRQFMLGDSLGWLRETQDALRIPLLVRPSSAIAIGSNAERPDYDFLSDMTLQVYEIANGDAISVAVPAAPGAGEGRFDLKRQGSLLTVQRQGPAKPWRLLLVGIRTVVSIVSGEAETDPKGTLVTPLNGVEYLEITIDDTA